MNGPQDAGGRHGFGPVRPDPDEPLFHAPWERRALAMTMAMGGLGQWTIDESRHAREARSPAEYYRLSYYGIWIAGLEKLLLDKAMVSEGELTSGVPDGAVEDKLPPLSPEGAVTSILGIAPYSRDPGGRDPAFAVGDPVRTRNLQPAGHIRMPSYCRDRSGTVTAVHGYHVFADTSADGDRNTAHWLYNVTFSARDLFGDRAGAGDTVSVDLWEPYLDAV